VTTPVFAKQAPHTNTAPTSYLVPRTSAPCAIYPFEIAPEIPYRTHMNTEHVPQTEPRESPVRFNAVKHGIYSVAPVVPIFESEDDWFNFRDSIFESLQPRGGLEEALADRVAGLLWRLMRTVRYERESIANSLATVRRDFETALYLRGEQPPGDQITSAMKEQMDRIAMDRLLPDDRTQNKIMRAETPFTATFCRPSTSSPSSRASAIPFPTTPSTAWPASTRHPTTATSLPSLRAPASPPPPSLWTKIVCREDEEVDGIRPGGMRR